MEHPTHNIDDLLRQRLHDAEVAPPPFVWPNVERSLHRRKRRFFLWFLAAGLAGAGIWTVWNRPLPTSVIQLELQPQPAQPLEQTTPRAKAQAIPGSPNPAATPETPELIANTAVYPLKTAAQAAKKGAGASGMFPAAATSPKSPYDAVAALPAAEASAGIAQPEPAVSFGAASVAPAAFSGAAILLSPLPAPHSTLAASNRQLAMPFVHPRVSKKKSAKKCYDFHANRQAWLLDVYAGPSFVRKTLDTGNPEFNDYVQDRLNTERQEVAFNAGVRASYLFSENFIVRTGLHYDQFTEKFEYIDPNFINTTIHINQQLVNGQWVTVSDTVIEYGANYIKTYNRFGLLDIPLQAALELRSGPTGISLNLGGSVNVLFWKRGNMLELNGKPAAFTPGKHQFDVFQPRISLSLLGSIQWYYHVDPKTRLFAEPYYRHILEPVTKPGYPVKQSYGIAGVRIGVTRILDVK